MKLLLLLAMACGDRDKGATDKACEDVVVIDGNECVGLDCVEVCDGVDNDCDGVSDDADGDWQALPRMYWPDLDGDGFGVRDWSVAQPACWPGEGWVIVGDTEEDCDDSDAASNPDGVELCGDGVDNDCDGETDPRWLCDTGDTGLDDTGVTVDSGG